MLHAKLLKVQEKHDLEIRELKQNNRQLKGELEDLKFIHCRTLSKVKELEKESSEKNNKISQPIGNSKTVVPNSGN